ncbi:PIN domain-like protein, partial [Coprinopsis sp. MPI-PUGE-AT-0042]
QTIRPCGTVKSLAEISISNMARAGGDGSPGFRLGIDASLWLAHMQYSKASKGTGKDITLRNFFFRCAKLSRSFFLPLFVFDGEEKPLIKRGVARSSWKSNLTSEIREILNAFGFEYTVAPGEADAELAYLNGMGIIDGILSDDADCLLFGGLTMIRNNYRNLSENRSNPPTNSAGINDEAHVWIFTASAIENKLGLTQGGMVLMALLSGGDYTSGIKGCGPEVALALARCGLGDQLYTATKCLSLGELEDFLPGWRNNLCAELVSNSEGHLFRKRPSLATSISDCFPDIGTVLNYTNPRVSGRTEPIHWSKEMNIENLVTVCKHYLHWDD